MPGLGPSRRLRTSPFYQQYLQGCDDRVSTQHERSFNDAANRIWSALRGHFQRRYNQEMKAQHTARGGGSSHPTLPENWVGGQAGSKPPTMAEHHWPGANRSKPPWSRLCTPHWSDPSLAAAAERRTKLQREVVPVEEDVLMQQLSRGQGISRGACEWLKDEDRLYQRAERSFDKESWRPPRHCLSGTYQRSEELNVTNRIPPKRGPGRVADQLQAAPPQTPPPPAHRYPHVVCSRTAPPPPPPRLPSAFF